MFRSGRRDHPGPGQDEGLCAALALITARVSHDGYAWSTAVAALPYGLGAHRLTEALLVITGVLAMFISVRREEHPTSVLTRAASSNRRSRAFRRAAAQTTAWFNDWPHPPPLRRRRERKALNMGLIELAEELAASAGDGSAQVGWPTVALAIQQMGHDDGRTSL